MRKSYVPRPAKRSHARTIEIPTPKPVREPGDKGENQARGAHAHSFGTSTPICPTARAPMWEYYFGRRMPTSYASWLKSTSQRLVLDRVVDSIIDGVLSTPDKSVPVRQALERAYPFGNEPTGRLIWDDALLRHAHESQSSRPSWADTMTGSPNRNLGD